MSKVHGSHPNEPGHPLWKYKQVAATVLNNVNGRFEKRFSNSNFVQCVDRDVGFFEAWVSVFDEVLNWKS